MERNYYTDEFEQLLKEKSDQFRMYPSKRVWHSIYNNLHPSRRWPSAAMSLLLIITLLLTGYLNTSDNSIFNQFANNNDMQNINENDSYPGKKAKTQMPDLVNNRKKQLPNAGSEYVAKAFITDESDIPVYTVVKSVPPLSVSTGEQNNQEDGKFTAEDKTPANSNTNIFQTTENTGKNIIGAIDAYIKTNHIFADIADANKKINVKAPTASAKNTNGGEFAAKNENEESKIGNDITAAKKSFTDPANSLSPDKPVNENTVAKKDIKPNDKSLSPEEKAWIENYALQNKPGRNKWKSKLAFEFYTTPAVNYRELSTDAKGSITPFATGDINRSISQKPGLGVETGLGLSYAFAKNLRLKAGIQFNYTNYNINADQTNHPVLTTILLNDPGTGYSYLASRTSTISNAYNSSALQPVQLHNRTYQISIPVGLAYRLSGTKNVEWFAGASVQPTYVFGGKAHLISADLKSYVSDPSSINNWNLNLGFETYMNFKLGAYNLQVGPQVRYQVYSTYRKNVALIEKPYAVGLKLGIVKGF